MAQASPRFSSGQDAALWALMTSLKIGAVHETLDHDLWDRKIGAPCNGLLDVAAFALVPFLAYQFGFVPLPLTTMPRPSFPGGMLPPPQTWFPRPPWSQLPQSPSFGEPGSWQPIL